MRILIIALMLMSSTVFAQKAVDSKKQEETKAKTQVVEASCGQCKFGLKGGGCDLAIKIDGKAYWLDGTGINDHGDSHGKEGFCMKVRKAEVSGEVIDGRFKATSFALLPTEEKK